MSGKTQTRHEQLIGAGWIYDVGSDRYRPPGSANNGTARMYNLDAAWLAYSTGTTLQPPATSRAPDPRRQEPQ